MSYDPTTDHHSDEYVEPADRNYPDEPEPDEDTIELTRRICAQVALHMWKEYQTAFNKGETDEDLETWLEEQTKV
jgi:hypothetical protein